MGLSNDARVVVLLADYIGLDAVGGKINAIGAGFMIAGVQPTGQTSPQFIAVMVELPSKYAGQEFAFSLELRDDDSGTIVQVPGLVSGQMDTMRIQQVAKAERPQVAGVYLPESMFLRLQVALSFPTGLPLPVGRFYSWRAQVDGHHRPEWQARFYVPAPPPPPVFGGPAGPADIPNLPRP